MNEPLIIVFAVVLGLIILWYLPEFLILTYRTIRVWIKGFFLKRKLKKLEKQEKLTHQHEDKGE